MNSGEIILKRCALSTRRQQSDRDNQVNLASTLKAPVTKNMEMMGAIHGGGIRFQNKEPEQLGEPLTKCSQHVNTELLGD